jgi:hypothetical protein
MVWLTSLLWLRSRAGAAQAVYASQVLIGTYMPSSTRIRIMARRPEWVSFESTIVSPTTEIRRHSAAFAVASSASAGSDGGQDAASFRAPAVAVATSAVASRTCGIAAPWRALWDGRAADGTDRIGRVAPAFLPADFPTRQLLVEACGLRRRGFANTDAGNVCAPSPVMHSPHRARWLMKSGHCLL